MNGAMSSPPPLQTPQHRSRPGCEPGQSVDHGPSSGRPQTNRTVFIPPRGFYLCGRSVMIYKGERFMHITTYHIPAKRRHIDAATRLRRLSHVVATSTHVVRGCKLPFPLMPSYAAPHSPCGRSTRHVPILRFSEVFAASLQRPKSFSGRLQHSCKGQKVFRGVCSIPANAKKFLGAFAAFLQTPKSFSCHLQRCCKDQKVSRGICSIPAKTKKFLGAFAAFLQRPKSFSGHLQHSCKGQKVFRGVCSVPAKAKKFFELLAAFLQRPKSFSGHLQHSCKHPSICFYPSE